MKTPAAILVEQRKPLVIDDVEIPALGFGQVLVEVAASRICGSQVGEIDGVKGADRFLPHLLGHEGSGTVLEVGPEVRHVKPMDRVVMHWRPGLGIESRGSAYSWNGRICNAGCITTFNRYSVVSENRLTPVPADTDHEVGALMADTITTGFGVINHDARVRIGESVVVIGCGGIGLGVILGAKLAGAYPVIAVDLHDHKLAKAREFGATHTVNSSTADFSQACEDILHGKADAVIDGTAVPAVLEKAFALAGPKGRCVVFGVMAHDRKISINTLPLHFGRVLTGSHGGGSEPVHEIPRYLRLLGHSGLDLRSMVSHRIGLGDINPTIEKMRAGEVIHAMIRFPGFGS